MENRLESRPDKPGAAFTAFVVILGITAAWWALALWPVGGVEPDWLVRTRAACFGSQRGGLPDAGGWILLIGEPIGMIGLLAAIWGHSLRRDLRWIIAHRAWRAVAATAVLMVMAGVAAVTARVARAAGAFAPAKSPPGALVPLDLAAPDVPLSDQHGRITSVAALRGTPVLLTFAFGHCTTVCPVVVQGVMAARRETNREDVPLVVITLDPWRDTPDRLAAIAQHWRLRPHDRLLSGSATDVARVLESLGVSGRRNEASGDVDHAATVMGLSKDGRIRWRIEGGFAQVKQQLPLL